MHLRPSILLPNGARRRSGRRLARKKYHMILNFIALVIAGVGTALIFINHNQLRYGRSRQCLPNPLVPLLNPCDLLGASSSAWGA